MQPDDPTVLGQHPVLHLERLASLEGSGRFADDLVSIIGVQRVDPEPRVRHPFLRPEAEDLLDLRAHELLDDLVEAALDAPDVDDRGDLLDEGPEPRLELPVVVRPVRRPVRTDGVRSPSGSARWMQTPRTYGRDELWLNTGSRWTQKLGL